ncbi:MAG TPA: DUF3108 domain-containing protein [Steroidobacteraceae bacterium]|nr:DUF3108 domain-containing protein [Steroidobacteraceae bacterium]
MLRIAYLRRHSRPWLPLLLLLAPGPVAWAAGSGPPAAFSATYAVAWHGITAGQSLLQLTAAGDAWRYTSRIQAHGIFRLVFPDALLQSSTFRLQDGRVAPLSYSETGQARDHSDDVSLTFDRGTGRVRGMAGRKIVDQPLVAGVQDPMSVQVELMRELAMGADPQRFVLFDKDESKEYRYTREGSVALDTALGRLATVLYRSDRPGSDRVTRLWLAPQLGYLPVRAERSRGGSVDLSLRILSLNR